MKSPKGMELELVKLENGYKRFDPQRGMEYMLDLRLRVTVESGTTEIRYFTSKRPRNYLFFLAEVSCTSFTMNLISSTCKIEKEFA